ncbi:MAG: hypothetical protein Q7W30_07815 [Coriobacteriia bacterium]|nr:hypothetical protein [Coriobacteriia bacterium]
MLRDLSLLLRLFARHARARADYWVALAGADTHSSRIGDRVYLAYVAMLVLGWCVAMLAAASAGAFAVGVELSPSGRALLDAVASALPPLAIAAFSIRALRSSPVKFTNADIACVGASALDTRAIAVCFGAREVVAVWMTASILGYLLGAAASGAGSPGAASSATALLSGAMVPAALLLAWAAGLVRVRIARPGVRWFRAIGSLGIAAGFVLLSSALRWPGTALVVALRGGAVAGDALALCAVGLLAGCAAVAAAADMDMIAVIEESGRYARLRALRPLRRYDMAAYSDAVRRIRLVGHRPLWHLPDGSGARALVGRALLSHVRQPASLVWPIVWGAAILPYLAASVGGAAGEFSLVLPAFLFVAGPSASLSQVFRQDIDRPSLRANLPFDNLRLLMADSAPVLCLIALTSALVMGVRSTSLGTWAGGTVLCVILGIIAALCSGLEYLRLPRVPFPVAYPVSAACCVGLILAASVGGGLAASCGMAAVVAVALGVAVRRTVQ